MIIVPGPRVQMGRPRFATPLCTRPTHLTGDPPRRGSPSRPVKKISSYTASASHLFPHTHWASWRPALLPTHTGRPGALSILRHRALPLSAHLNALGHGRHHVPELVRSIGIQPMHSIPDPAPERLLPLPPTRLRRRQPAIEQRPRVLDGVKIRGIGGHCAPRGPESDGRKPAAGPPTPREGGRIPLRRTAELAPRVCGRRAPSLQPKRERYGTTHFSGTS